MKKERDTRRRRSVIIQHKLTTTADHTYKARKLQVDDMRRYRDLLQFPDGIQHSIVLQINQTERVPDP